MQFSLFAPIFFLARRKAAGRGFNDLTTMGKSNFLARSTTFLCQSFEIRQNLIPERLAFSSQEATSLGTIDSSRVSIVLSTSKRTYLIPFLTKSN